MKSVVLYNTALLPRLRDAGLTQIASWSLRSRDDSSVISSLMHLVTKYHVARSRSKLRDVRWIGDIDGARYMIHDECFWF